MTTKTTTACLEIAAAALRVSVGKTLADEKIRRVALREIEAMLHTDRPGDSQPLLFAVGNK